MIKYLEANPLAVFGLRELPFCPPHFEKTTIDANNAQQKIINWIHENTEGRFYTSYSNASPMITIAFEIPSELSYLIMCLQSIVAIDDTDAF